MMNFIGSDEQRVALYSALAAASAKFSTVENDTTGQSGNRTFRYASLDTLIACTRPALAEHGLFVMQTLSGPISRVSGSRRPALPTDRGDKEPIPASAVDETEIHLLTTSILHDEGGSLESTIEYNKPPTVTVWGAYTTYLRRYAYRAIFGLDGTDDPDGGEQRPHQRCQEPPVATTPTPRPDLASADEMKELGAAAREVGLNTKSELDAAFVDAIGHGLFEPDGRPGKITKKEHAKVLAHIKGVSDSQ